MFLATSANDVYRMTAQDLYKLPQLKKEVITHIESTPCRVQVVVLASGMTQLLLWYDAVIVLRVY